MYIGSYSRAIYFEKSRIPCHFDDMIYYSEGCSIIDRPLRSFLQHFRVVCSNFNNSPRDKDI